VIVNHRLKNLLFFTFFFYIILYLCLRILDMFIQMTPLINMLATLISAGYGDAIVRHILEHWGMLRDLNRNPKFTTINTILFVILVGLVAFLGPEQPIPVYLLLGFIGIVFFDFSCFAKWLDKLLR